MTTVRESKRARAVLDARLAHFDPADFAAPRGGWIRAIRDALGMPAAELGRRLNVTHSAVFELERSERAGTIKLNSLRRAAEALDCTLVYALVPKRGLDVTVQSQAEGIADDDLRYVEQTMALEDQAVEVTARARDELVQRLLDTRGLWSRRP
jgi:predicted DNA-binding mobile mystery protein A